MNRPERTHIYSDMIYDSTRWDGERGSAYKRVAHT